MAHPHIDTCVEYNNRVEIARSKVEENFNLEGTWENQSAITVTLNQPNSDEIAVWMEFPTIPFMRGGSHAYIVGNLHIRLPFSRISEIPMAACIGYHALGSAGTELSVAEGGDIAPATVLFNDNDNTITVTLAFKEN